MTTSSIHKNVMRRVRTIHVMRPLMSTTAFSTLLLLGALWGIGRQVWVARVFENLSFTTDLATFTNFLVSAFTQTEFVVQALTVLALAAFVWIIRDGVQNLRYTIQSA